ncbi:MAG: hypothetical protein ACRDZN_12685, partial [Acidimicrobiales bacterium]
VTAAALAVLLIGVSVLVDDGGEPDDVAISKANRSPTRRAVQLPNKVEMRCGPRGIEIPVASVRPQRDGLHVRVINDQAVPTEVWVTGADWSSGRLTADPGVKTLRLPVPPGVLTLGCQVAGRDDRRRVDLDDVDGHYQSPELVCDGDERRELRDLPVDGQTDALATAARVALERYWVDGVTTAGPVDGYEGQRLGDITDDPVVQIEREGDPVAFVYLRGRDGEPKAPWTTARLVVGCKDFLVDDPVTSTTAA